MRASESSTYHGAAIRAVLLPASLALVGSAAEGRQSDTARPAPPVFTQSYGGERVSGIPIWKWRAGEGGGQVLRYRVTPGWLEQGFVETSTVYYADRPPGPGTYRIEVSAINDAGESAPVADEVIVHELGGTFGSTLDRQGNPLPAGSGICQNHLLYHLLDYSGVEESFKEGIVKIRVNEVHSLSNPLSINASGQYFRFLFNSFDLYTDREERGRAGFNFRMHASAGGDQLPETEQAITRSALPEVCGNVPRSNPRSHFSFAYYGDTSADNLQYGIRSPQTNANWNLFHQVVPGADAIKSAVWSSFEGVTTPTGDGQLLDSGDWFRSGDTVILHVKRIGRDPAGMVPFDAAESPYRYIVPAEQGGCETRWRREGDYFEWAAYLTVQRKGQPMAIDRWFGSYLLPVEYGTRIRLAGPVFEVFDEDADGLGNAPLDYTFLYFKGLREDGAIVDLEHGRLSHWIEGGCFTSFGDASRRGDRRFGVALSPEAGFSVRLGHDGDEQLLQGGDRGEPALATSWSNQDNSWLKRDGIEHYGKD